VKEGERKGVQPSKETQESNFEALERLDTSAEYTNTEGRIKKDGGRASKKRASTV